MCIEIMVAEEQKISQSALDALEAEICCNLSPIYPNTAIRIRCSSANGLQLRGVHLDEDKQRVIEILQQVWEGDSWLH